VVNKEAPADGSPRVNLNASEEPADLRDKAGQQRDVPAVELVGQTVRKDGMETRVAEKDLNDAFRRRVFAKDSIELFPDRLEHLLDP
jgi:hypothetical protein